MEKTVERKGQDHWVCPVCQMDNRFRDVVCMACRCSVLETDGEGRPISIRLDLDAIKATFGGRRRRRFKLPSRATMARAWTVLGVASLIFAVVALAVAPDLAIWPGGLGLLWALTLKVKGRNKEGANV